jgi:hypothetical protein
LNCAGHRLNSRRNRSRSLSENPFVALTPTSDQPDAEKAAVRRAAEQDVLLREVDEAVRQDEATEFFRRYGKAVIAAVIVGLAAFGGWLWWKDHREARREKVSEEYVQALDQIDAGDTAKATAALDPIAQKGTPAAKAAATMLEAGLMIAKGDSAHATTMLFKLADDKDAPEEFRNLAAIRGVAASFDTMKPEAVIARLKPLARPGNPWFGSAGELVAAAYLKQGKKDLAGPLFAAIAKDKDAPRSLQIRAREMAGQLGYDAVTDVDQLLAEQRSDGGGTAPGAQ